MSGAIWDQVIGQDGPIAALRRGLAGDRGASGYLFRGPDQIGKTTVALGLAQALNCTGPQPPCGQCRPCRDIAAGNHPDVRVVEPERMGGSGPFRPKIHKIDTVRSLLHEASLRGGAEGWRVIVLVSADALREDAANTLLKTLEEPPARMVFVLTTEQPAMLLPTITSRLRRLDLGLVPTASVVDWLTNVHSVPAAQAQVDAALAAGRPGRALALSGDPTIQAFRTELLGRAARLGSEPTTAALLSAAWLAGGDEEGSAGDRVAWGLELLEWWYRDALVLAAGGESGLLVHRDFERELLSFTQRYGAVACRGVLGALAEARLALGRNGNASLVLEVLWLRMARGQRVLGRP